MAVQEETATAWTLLLPTIRWPQCGATGPHGAVSWGWDDGLLALSMTRLGWSPRSIVDGPLLDPKFPYYKNGHTLCCPVYLPCNGALLSSISALAAGSSTSPPMNFPPEWSVLAEGFPMPYP